jgi:Protein of unknown function (DUF1445)
MAITREIERGQSLATGLAARLACHRGTTAAVAPGYAQGNLAALPADLAADFLRFCQSNPKPCPLIGVSDVGNPRIPSLGLGLDLNIRTDLPGYRVWNDGEPRRGDRRCHQMVARGSRRLCHRLAFVRRGARRGRHAAAAYRTVATRTHVPQQYRLHARRPLLRPDGRFDAPAETAPGDPDHLAIPRSARRADSHWAAGADRDQESRKTRLRRRDRSESGRLPVFWACGVTPQPVVANVKPPFAIRMRPAPCW